MKNTDGTYQLYNDEMMERFLNPKNMGTAENENAVGECGSAACGDIMRISLRINENSVIEDAKAKIFGCGSAISAADVACDLLRGKTIEEAKKITNDDVMNELGGADEWRAHFPVKIHCSVLASEGFLSALADYEFRKSKL